MAEAATRALDIDIRQFRSTADLAVNVERMEEAIRDASETTARLVVFHECALTGYPGDEIPDCSHLRRSAVVDGLRRLAAAADRAGVAVLLGAAEPTSEGTYNSAYLLNGGRARRVCRKQTLFGDEDRHFLPGAPDNGTCVVVDGVRVGVRICFDVRFPELFRQLLRRRCELAVVLFHMTDHGRWKIPVGEAHLVSRAAENGFPVLSCNALGHEQNMRSCLVDADGRLVDAAPLDREASLSVRVEIGGDAPPLRKRIVATARALDDDRRRPRP